MPEDKNLDELLGDKGEMGEMVSSLSNFLES
jgi:hypothetical protein